MEDFQKYFSPDDATPEHYRAVRDLFDLIDLNNNGIIEIEELMFGLLSFAKGTPDEKIEAAFILFDTDDSLTMDKKEL